MIHRNIYDIHTILYIYMYLYYTWDSLNESSVFEINVEFRSMISATWYIIVPRLGHVSVMRPVLL